MKLRIKKDVGIKDWVVFLESVGVLQKYIGQIDIAYCDREDG